MVEVMPYVITLLPWVIGILIFAAVLILIITSVRNKMIFSFKHKTIRLRKDGKSKEISGKAGFITKRNGNKYFRIKLGRMPWQKFDLIEHPDLDEMDGDNRVYYLQLSPDIFVQSSRNLIPTIEYTDYVRDKNGELVQMKDDKGEDVWLRNRKGELVYETAYEYKDGKQVEVKNTIPIYVPVGKEYKIIEEIKPIKNVEKAYNSAILASVDRAIEGEANWKTALVWVGGAVMIIVVTLLAFYFLGGGFASN